jgi:HNH endonuclease
MDGSGTGAQGDRVKAAILDITTDTIERFWSHVDVGEPDECWPWTAARWANGYGVFAVRHGVLVGAHQVASFLFNGKPDSLELYALHHCDNPPCCNGAHLFWGTNQINQLDSSAKGRHHFQKNPDLVKRGADNPNARLTLEQVEQIRSATGLNSVQLAAIYGVTSTHIRYIQKGKSWA